MASVIHDLGKENKTYITKHDLRNFLSTHFRGIQRLIRHIHFHDDHPENHNIRPTTNDNTTIDVCLDGEFTSLNKEYVLDTLIMDAWKTLVEFYYSLEDSGDLNDFEETLVSQETMERIDQFVHMYRSICDGDSFVSNKDLHDGVFEMIKYQSSKCDKTKKKNKPST